MKNHIFQSCATLAVSVGILLSAHTAEAVFKKDDHAIYETLLAKYVSDGRVDYLAWKRDDLAVFEKYIQSLAGMSTEGMSADEEKAFWINTYNALTVYAVLKQIPPNFFLSRVFSVQLVPGFFRKKIFTVAGETLSLDAIEHTRLRKRFKDPRVHFVIVCASTSCPALQSRIFYPEGLDARLDEAARDFMYDTRRNRLDRENNVFHLSSIFQWYQKDFISDDEGILAYVKKYLDPADREFASDPNVTVQYLYYDWLVNIKK
ncbi:MAG: DUF547 domain-containing protein [Candidatus Omnitrophota bacterium]